jgi:hypothetical protein
MQGGGLALHIADLFCDVEGLLVEGDRLVNLALIGFESAQLMQGGGLALHIADLFL